MKKKSASRFSKKKKEEKIQPYLDKFLCIPLVSWYLKQPLDLGLNLYLGAQKDI